MQVIDLISSALRLIGQLAQGETPSNDEAVDAMAALNDILDEWNTERVNLYNVGFQTQALTIGKGSYQIGTGAADFNVARPVMIQSASLILTNAGSIEVPMDLLDSVKWAAEMEKTLQGNLPRKLYNDYAFPISTLYVLPVPSAACSLKLFTWTILSAFATLQDTVSFPPGYSKALRYALAANLAPEYNVPLAPDVAQIAAGAKSAVIGLNSKYLGAASSHNMIPAAGLPQEAPAPPVTVAQPQE